LETHELIEFHWLITGAGDGHAGSFLVAPAGVRG
jgi:hypothetical protein